ncbi:DNA polymerase III subunit beta family protein [Saccharothrix obliqua]|uniref:DNA polymerase III subunit beta family protein n=1 Tax=Saccharothrix obliqua TaxID=2861747 RepID=UPI001C5F1FD6|nr:MerR family transcriptional regulator [Saccharothrix obliqua]MBW4718160.1 MerR family transcriptional regulator [Saccharothrix obliqua]
MLTIGVFARACGLTASALRFYADSGLLRPASVDHVSGYRYYARDQVARAVAIRRLREIDMPLERIGEVLGGAAGEAARIVDEHVAGLAERARHARETAVAVKAALGGSDARSPATSVDALVTGVNALVFTTAVEQVLTATTHEPGLPVLNGVRIDVSSDTVVLTATDRYRLSTRTLVPTRPGPTWSATVDADDLRPALPWTRRQHDLRLSARTGHVRLWGDETTRDCRTLTEPYPDHRLLLASLPEARTRVLVPRNALARGLEEQHAPRVRLDVSATGLVISSPNGRSAVTADVTGPGTVVEFAAATLHPAVTTAVGPDVMLDLALPHEPVVVRSADDGDLTTLVMPLRPEPGGTTG